MVLLCHRKHPLVKVTAPESREVTCDVCNSSVATGHSIFRCATCDWDSCESCFEKRSAEDAVSYDGVVELMRLTEAARRIDMQSKGWKVPDLQAMCRILGQPEKGLKAELISRIATCEGVGEVLTRDDRYRSPVGTRGAATVRASAPANVPSLPGSESTGSNSAAGSGSSSAQGLTTTQAAQPATVTNAVKAHEQAQLSRAQAASLTFPVPGGQPSPLQPLPGVGATIPPPASSPHADMAVDSQEEDELVPQQQPVAPQQPQHPQPIHLSPVVARHKAKFQELFARNRAPLPPLEAIPALPTDAASSEVLQTLANGMNTLITGVNELRVSCADTVKVKDLETFREIQSEEFREMVTVHTEPIRRDVADQGARIQKLEAAIERIPSSGTSEASLMRIMNETDPAFRQIAFTGFKITDLQKRNRILREFAAQHFGEITIAHAETIMNGPWKGRKPTSTAVVEFFSRDARDAALAIAKSKKVLDGPTDLGLTIDRARTKVQRSRNWALRKAEELAKVEAHRRGISGAARIAWEMPVRRVYIGDELAFAQKATELRGIFVDAFAACALPA